MAWCPQLMRDTTGMWAWLSGTHDFAQNHDIESPAPPTSHLISSKIIEREKSEEKVSWQVSVRSIAKGIRAGQHLCVVFGTSALRVFNKKSAKMKGVGDFKVVQDIQKHMAVLSSFQSKFFIVQPINNCLMGPSTILGTWY